MSSGDILISRNKNLDQRKGTGELGIENTNIKTAPGVSLNESQETLVGVVLDVREHLRYIELSDSHISSLQLFAGRPSLKKLATWADDGIFEDPITVAKGRAQYEAQWVSPPSIRQPLSRTP